MKYTTIAVIYNPNSTGSSKRFAETFKARLKVEMPKQKVTLIATTHAGHGEELAYKIAKETRHPLIISSSGDGGYNDVINGALRAQAEGAHPTTGLLPAGNANDHYRNLHQEDIVHIIAHKKPVKIDVLRLTGVSRGKVIERLAHSYIGFGLTPDVSKELNNNTLNVFNQVWIVAKALLTTRAVRLKIDSKTRLYDSIIFSNVDSMSKLLTISQPSRMNDGKFEVTIFRKRTKLKLILLLLKSSVIGVKEDMQVSEFALETSDKAALVQLDGEILTLDANSKVAITTMRRALSCIV